MRQELDPLVGNNRRYEVALAVTVITLCVSLNVLAGFFLNAFHYWKSLLPPPSTPTHIINADPDGLWIETSSNQIYIFSIDCFREHNCHHSQWMPIDNVSDIKAFNYGFINRGNDCVSISAPDWGSPRNPRGKILECVRTTRPGMDIAWGFDVYYVLMDDGSIMFREYTPPPLLLPLICMTPSILLILITVSVYMIKRGRRKKEQQAGAAPVNLSG